ncbi:MAG: hypothetical protein KGJ86_00885 [Chloroflexota bacterium]|nr:hypothetical protein [Chloroflexota bacterium]
MARSIRPIYAGSLAALVLALAIWTGAAAQTPGPSLSPSATAVATATPPTTQAVQLTTADPFGALYANVTGVLFKSTATLGVFALLFIGIALIITAGLGHVRDHSNHSTRGLLVLAGVGTVCVAGPMVFYVMNLLSPYIQHAVTLPTAYCQGVVC